MCSIPTRWRRCPSRRRRSRCGHREEDELAHAATDEPLWSESWYADFVDAAQGLGGWFRIGLIANQQTAWVHALLCGPDLPTIAIVDFEVPLPERPVGAAHRRLRARPLRRRAAADLPRRRCVARAQAYPDPSALLRGEPGTPVEMTMNLVWTTDGTPYKYRLTTRYEIPCTVSGTVTVDDTRYRSIPSPGSATTRGGCATGGAWTGCGARCTSTTAPICTVLTSEIPAHPGDQHRLRSGPRRQRHRAAHGEHPRNRSTPTGYRKHDVEPRPRRVSPPTSTSAATRRCA